MCGIKTRGRGRKNGTHEIDGDPKKLRHRRGKGRNRSQKRQDGTYKIVRGAKATETVMQL